MKTSGQGVCSDVACRVVTQYIVLVREGTRCARHLPYQDPHEAHHNRDAALNRDAARHVATNPSPQQEAVLVHLGFYLLREGF